MFDIERIHREARLHKQSKQQKNDPYKIDIEEIKTRSLESIQAENKEKLNNDLLKRLIEEDERRESTSL